MVESNQRKAHFRTLKNGSSDILDESRPQHLMVKMNQDQQNGLEQKPGKEIKVKVNEGTETVMEFISEDIIKKHMSKSRGKTYPQAKLYNKNGLELADDDILYMKTGDVVYLARHGEPFNYQQVLDRYERLQKLGSGGFGKVYLCRDKENDNLYAIKVINMSEYMQKADGIYEIDREAKTLRMLNSKYIIQLENYFIHSQKEVILVMEYAQGGELKQYIDKKPSKRVSEFECQTLMRQIVGGLASCHQKGIIHRDLKLENILFYDKEQTHLKIADFGIAGFCLKHLKEKTDSGTFKYMAPEVLKGDINLANPQMDIWALGIMMYLMLFGQHPFIKEEERKNYDNKVVVQRIINDPVEIPTPQLQQLDDKVDILNNLQTPLLTQSCGQLLLSLLNKNPRERIALLEVKEHTWFDLTEQEIKEQQQQIIRDMLDSEKQKQERIKQRLNKQMQKRNTLVIPNVGLSSFTNSRLQNKSPMAFHNSISQQPGIALPKKMSTLQPNINPFKNEENKQQARRVLKAKVQSTIEADTPKLPMIRKKQSMSPIGGGKVQNNNQMFIKKI